jgi:hypothetical protein
MSVSIGTLMALPVRTVKLATPQETEVSCHHVPGADSTPCGYASLLHALRATLLN